MLFVKFTHKDLQHQHLHETSGQRKIQRDKKWFSFASNAVFKLKLNHFCLGNQWAEALQDSKWTSSDREGLCCTTQLVR